MRILSLLPSAREIRWKAAVEYAPEVLVVMP
jgi:hypothetical protein